MGVPFVVLYYGGAILRPLYQFALPLILTGVIYDSLRFLGPYIRGPINVTGPYYLERALFAWPTEAGLLLPSEWWQLNTHPVLDFVTGLSYYLFVPQFLLCAFYFCFISRARRSCWLPWSFFWVNLLGYVTQQVYPAAPPWYVELNGLGPADPSAPPSAAGCLRFDALIGTDFFGGMYARSANVFGAIPSLHVAYPMLVLSYAIVVRQHRLLSLAFFLLVSFAAVYLNHHYVIDVLLGSLYSISVAAVLECRRSGESD